MADAKPASFTEQIDRVRQYLEEGPVEDATARPEINRLRALGQFIYFVGRGFIENRLATRAAALSYTLLLALVPLLAVVLSVSKNFLHDTSANVVPQLIDTMIANVAPQLEFVPVAGQAPAAGKPGQVVVSTQARKEAVQRIQSFIENINAGALGTVGTLLLIVVAIRLMMSIEESFNDVWGVTQGRSLYKKIVYYWATITLGPLMVILAIGVTSSMEYSSLVGRLDFIPGFERAFLFIAPFVVLWISFGLMYALMPNTRVTFRAALIGGIVGGTLWQLNNLLNTIYVSRVISYSKIYGSLGMIPVVLLGLYFSWVIVLLGAQSSFVAQNLRSFMQHRASERVDEEGREFIACRVVLLACAQFLRGQPPPTFDDVGARLGVPAPLLNRVVRRLTGGGVLSETGGDLRALVPVRPPDQITLADVLHVLRTNNGVCGEVPSVSGNDMAANSLRELFLAERSSPSNARFSDLAARLGATGGAQS